MIERRTQVAVKTLLREFMDAWIAKQYAALRRIEQEGVSPTGTLAPFHDLLLSLYRGVGEQYTPQLDDLRAALAGRS